MGRDGWWRVPLPHRARRAVGALFADAGVVLVAVGVLGGQDSPPRGQMPTPAQSAWGAVAAIVLVVGTVAVIVHTIRVARRCIVRGRGSVLIVESWRRRRYWRNDVASVQVVERSGRRRRHATTLMLRSGAVVVVPFSRTRQKAGRGPDAATLTTSVIGEWLAASPTDSPSVASTFALPASARPAPAVSAVGTRPDAPLASTPTAAPLTFGGVPGVPIVAASTGPPNPPTDARVFERAPRTPDVRFALSRLSAGAMIVVIVVVALTQARSNGGAQIWAPALLALAMLYLLSAGLVLRRRVGEVAVGAGYFAVRRSRVARWRAVTVRDVTAITARTSGRTLGGVLVPLSPAPSSEAVLVRSITISSSGRALTVSPRIFSPAVRLAFADAFRSATGWDPVARSFFESGPILSRRESPRP